MYSEATEVSNFNHVSDSDPRCVLFLLADTIRCGVMGVCRELRGLWGAVGSCGDAAHNTRGSGKRGLSTGCPAEPSLALHHTDVLKM